MTEIIKKTTTFFEKKTFFTSWFEITNKKIANQNVRQICIAFELFTNVNNIYKY